LVHCSIDSTVPIGLTSFHPAALLQQQLNR
jgi:hypothetical protein